MQRQKQAEAEAEATANTKFTDYRSVNMSDNPSHSIVDGVSYPSDLCTPSSVLRPLSSVQSITTPYRKPRLSVALRPVDRGGAEIAREPALGVVFLNRFLCISIFVPGLGVDNIAYLFILLLIMMVDSLAVLGSCSYSVTIDSDRSRIHAPYGNTP